MNSKKPQQWKKALKMVIPILIIFISSIAILLPKDFKLFNYFPTGADIMSHVYSAKYLLDSLLTSGHLPHINPNWYNGFESIHNTALFIYFPMAVIDLILGLFKWPIYLSGTLIFILEIFLTGLGAFFYAKRHVSKINSVLVALAYIFSQAYIEHILDGGSATRAGAFVFIPWAFIAVDNIFLNNRRKLNIVLLAFLISLAILSHPMSGAALAGIIFIYGFIWSSFDFAKKRAAFGGMLLATVLGFGLTAWYLVPFFKEQLGWTSLNAQVLETFSIDPHKFYQLLGGIPFIILFVFFLLIRRNFNEQRISLFLTAIIAVVLSFGKYFALYNVFSVLGEIYPYIFLTIASFIFSFLFVSIIDLRGNSRLWQKSVFLIVVILLIVFNFFFSKKLLIENPSGMFKVDEEVSSLNLIDGQKGRVFPMKYPFDFIIYFLSINNKPTVEGWYYSVSPTGAHLAWYYEAINYGWPDFAVRYLKITNSRYLLGNWRFIQTVDSKTNILNKEYREFFDKLKRELNLKEVFNSYKSNDAGFVLYESKQPGEYFQVLKNKMLVIGDKGSVPSAVLPNSVMAGSEYIDDYSLDTLSLFPVLVLEGFKYHNKESAENLIKSYAAEGNTVIADYSNFHPILEDDYPTFLGVQGIREKMSGKMTLTMSSGRRINLDLPNERVLPSETGTEVPEGEEYSLQTLKEWRATSYLNLDDVLVTMRSQDEEAPIIGSKNYGSGKIWFVGPNLWYYIFLSHNEDLQAIVNQIIPESAFQEKEIDAEITILQNDPEEKRIQTESVNSFPLLGSYTFSPHWQVYFDGQKISPINIQDMLLVNVPAGSHSIEFKYRSTKVHYYGDIFSILSLLICGYLIFSFRKKNEIIAQ